MLGIDGIPVELYLALWYILGPIWLETVNYAVENGWFHQDLNTALIAVVPKPGKDPLECTNYRLISLTKTVSKYLENQGYVVLS